jgi:hypothetical protein
MPTDRSCSVAPLPRPLPEAPVLRSFSYRDPDGALSDLMQTLRGCGCALVAHKSLHSGQLEIYFELPLRAAMDAYAALLELRLELTRESHLQMSTFCTLRQHDRTANTIVPIRLLVKFLHS